MKVLVTGATGYIGGRLIPVLLEQGHELRIVVRDPKRIQGREWYPEVETVKGDLTDSATLEGVAEGMDAAYYLVHSMMGGADFAERDKAAVNNFADAADAAGGIGHVIYLGGHMPESGSMPSEHLSSRSQVGEMLRNRLPATEFRAGAIIGSGSASFEIVRYLTERLPVMVTPRWVQNECQPIGIRDIIRYLSTALEKEPAGVVEVGAERLTFKEMMQGYAEVRGLTRVIIPLPVLTPKLAAMWIGLVTPIQNTIAVPIVEGLVHSVTADTAKARELFPEIIPMSYRKAVELALRRIKENRVVTRWTNSMGGAGSYELSSSEGLEKETASIHVKAGPETVFRTVSSLGGNRGWPAMQWAWQLRGEIDQLAGGPGLRRGRRDPEELLPGDPLDFWRVEEIEPMRYLLLRAEMKVPGRAWLQFEVVPEGEGTRLVQTAIFEPFGLGGLAYWYSLYPAHKILFSKMLKVIAKDAENAPAHENSSGAAV